MSPSKLLAACAIGALALSSTAAHAVVIPTTADVIVDIDLSIEIEGGTIAAVMTPIPDTTTETTGAGPNIASLTASLTQVSSIDQGCITPTFGCVVSYDIDVFASAFEGTADARATFITNEFEIVVEDSAFLTVSLDTFSFTTLTQIGNGENPGTTTNSAFGGVGFQATGSDIITVLPSSRGDLVEGQIGMIDILEPGTYRLFIGGVEGRANAGQDAPAVEVDAPHSLALLGFGLIALGGIRRRCA